MRTRMRQLKGVTMKVQYEEHSREPVPAFYYEGRQLFHLHARGSEINATIHTDYKSRLKLVDNPAIDWRLREQVKKRTWAGLTIHNSKDIAQLMDLVRAKYQLINEEITGKHVEDRPTAF